MEDTGEAHNDVGQDNKGQLRREELPPYSGNTQVAAYGINHVIVSSKRKKLTFLEQQIEKQYLVRVTSSPFKHGLDTIVFFPPANHLLKLQQLIIWA